MSPRHWRAAELGIPAGLIAIDVTGSGQLARVDASVIQDGTSRPLSSLADLRDVLRQSGTSAEQLARAHPVDFSYLMCVLSGRLHRVLTSELLWSTLEKVLAPADAADRLRIEPGRLTFITITLNVPNFSVIRIAVDLATLDVQEEELATLPWPLSRLKAAQAAS